MSWPVVRTLSGSPYLGVGSWTDWERSESGALVAVVRENLGYGRYTTWQVQNREFTYGDGPADVEAAFMADKQRIAYGGKLPANEIGHPMLFLAHPVLGLVRVLAHPDGLRWGVQVDPHSAPVWAQVGEGNRYSADITRDLVREKCGIVDAERRLAAAEAALAASEARCADLEARLAAVEARVESDDFARHAAEVDEMTRDARLKNQREIAGA